MNTKKILVGLVIGIALIGLTGAASAQGSSYTGYSDYSHIDILDTETPTTIDVDSATCFNTVIGHFDNSYGAFWPGAPVVVGAGVQNSMFATPIGTGVEHQIATQGGSAAITIRSLDSENGTPELEAEITSQQSLWYSGSFTDYYFGTSDIGFAGAYGLLSYGLGEGNGDIIMFSESEGEGFTYTEGGIIDRGTFSVANYGGMIVDLEGVAPGEADINVYGGAAGASSFSGAVNDWGSIHTDIWTSETVSVDTGWPVTFPPTDCFP
ncbi:MAG: hypothetical protein WBB08_08240 [Halobacteriota archaeon]